MELKIKSMLAVFLLLTSGAALGIEQSFIADTERFGVRLFLVPDADAFVEMWSKPETPKLTVFKQTTVNTKFAGIILYWGGGANSNGECNIQLQTTVLERGTVLATGPEMPVCSRHQPPKPSVLSLSDTIIDLIASGDPTQLVVQVKVTDKINNETLLVEAPIEVVAE